MNPLVQFKPELKTIPNYWEIDNQLALAGEFKKLYSEDKSKNKQDSSLIMWAVCFYTHPESRFLNFSTKEKRSLIETDIVRKELNWDYVNNYINEYKKLYLTQAKRSLENWKEKLEERDEYLQSLPYKALTLDDAKLLDVLLANTPKLYQQYEDIKQQISDEDAKTINKAGIKESASEKGDI